tara:strand:- start:1989 stop:2984 length:996 start_codon:yes stop_codon:yes gene_type:complete
MAKKTKKKVVKKSTKKKAKKKVVKKSAKKKVSKKITKKKKSKKKVAKKSSKKKVSKKATKKKKAKKKVAKKSAKKKVSKKTTKKKKSKKKVTKKTSKKKVSKKTTKKKKSKKKVAKKSAKKKVSKKTTKKKKAKKKVTKKSSKKRSSKKVSTKIKSKPTKGKIENNSKHLKIPLDYSINNLESFNKPGTDEELASRKDWLLELKDKSQELLNVLNNWSEAYERKDIEINSWVIRADSESARTDKENSLRLFKPEQITDYIEHNIIKWIKEPSDPKKAYSFALDDFEKVFEKICHIRSENTTPMGFSSDVRHLGRFLEIIDNNIKSMLERNE